MHVDNASPPDTQATPRRVLQVEDNPANALVVEQLLARRDDLVVLTASSGQQGVELALSFMPDVILMDIRMPRLDGLRAMKALRSNSGTCHIPVIALSSNAHPSQIKEGLNAGFFRYMTKPYWLDELIATLDLALGITAPCRSGSELHRQ